MSKRKTISKGNYHGTGQVKQLKQHQKLKFFKKKFCYQCSGVTQVLSILNSYHPTDQF